MFWKKRQDEWSPQRLLLRLDPALDEAELPQSPSNLRQYDDRPRTVIKQNQDDRSRSSLVEIVGANGSTTNLATIGADETQQIQDSNEAISAGEHMGGWMRAQATANELPAEYSGLPAM